jgi:putative transposase
MSNHYHLLVQTPEPNLSRAMQWVNVSYATYFNVKRGRHGHLFQGRFKAILIDADAYLKHLSRYIHLNPVRAKMVSTPSEYVWSSHPFFIGDKKAPEYLDTEWLLSGFGKNKKAAKQSYKEFVEGTDLDKIENPGKHIEEGFLLGDIDFVNWVKEAFLSKRQDEKDVPQLKKLKPKISPDTVTSFVRKAYKCNEEDIIVRGRKNNEAREVAIYISRDICGLLGKDLGEYFGGVSGALVTMMYNRVAEEVAQNQGLRSKIKRIKNEIFNI